jgi:hypothetical protein
MPSTTTQPWTPTVKPIKQGITDYSNLYQSGGLRRSYGPSRVAGLNSSLGSFWDQTEQRARQGGSLLPQSKQYYSDVLGGKYLGADAPGFSDVLAKTRDMVNANASAGSRYGSGTHDAALTRELGGLQYSNYLNERGIMDNAAAMAPEIDAADYFDLDRLGEIGGARQGYDQMLADETANKFAFEQQAPEDAIQRYLALLASVGGLGSISSGPGGGGAPGVNPWLTGAGIATDLASSYLGAGGTFGF